MTYAQSLRTFERHCNSDVVNINEHADWEAEFWQLLGGKPANIKAAVQDDAPDSVETSYKFWEIKLAGSKVNLNEVQERPLREEMLKTENVYILELNSEIHIWIGKEADLDEKKNALYIGKGFIQQHNKPKGTKVYRIVENTEKAYFKSFFSGMFKTIKQDLNVQEETQAMIEQIAENRAAIHNSLLNQLGNLEFYNVYLCKDGNLIEIPKEAHGHFFQDEIYLIDIKGSLHRYLLTWIGPRLSAGDVAPLSDYALKHTNYEMIVNEEVRMFVQQGHEDDTLLKFFPHFIAHDGPHLSLQELNQKIMANGAMYRVQGHYGMSPVAVQQDQMQAINLNSTESFLVV
jgi:hypothetical protein